MNVIATLRSLLAISQRGATGVLLIAVVIAGVVSMHSMSGSPSAHMPPPGVVAPHAVGQHGWSGATSAEAVHPTSTQPDAPAVRAADDAVGCPAGCGPHDAHDMTTAMCLMVLVVLLTLAAPPASFFNSMLLSLARRILVDVPHWHLAPAPSLHALGISRT
ncbi:hypothetical protein [Promicromonospora aerolata]|uniref:DUF2946 family protein n=1 Tax=Promicromonospora aerolata TaxID=195749 RepID=A0ABW4VBS1_9MICO